MMGTNSNMVFPEVVNRFNVYNGADRLVGVSGEVSLAELNAITATVSGAGILGEYSTAVIGMFQDMQQEIPFRMVNNEFFRLMDTSRQAEIVLRAGLQCVDRKTGGALAEQGMRIAFRGRPVAFKPGKLKQADLMDASVTLALTYYLIEMGGVKMMELDKLNEIYVVNGRDLMAEIRRLC